MRGWMMRSVDIPSNLCPLPSLFMIDFRDFVDVMVPFCVFILASRLYGLFVEFVLDVMDGDRFSFSWFHLVHIPFL